MLWLSGADRTTLAECPGERNKFIGLGGVILTTATMAAVSAAVALVIGARVHPAVAALAGLLWGLAIMNLDRWLVSATARREHWHQNLFVAVPRLLLAVIIGVVISTPLVLWIFQREIDARLNVMIEQKSKDFQEQLVLNPRFAQIKPLQDDVARLEAAIHGTAPLGSGTELDRLRGLRDTAKTAYDKAVEDSLAEWEGRGPSGRVGNGPIWREKKAIETQRKTEYDNAEGLYRAALATFTTSSTAELERKRADLDKYSTERDAQLARFEEDNKDDRGLLARLDALTALTDTNGTLKAAYICLLLFITVIEILPVLVKFLMSLGPPSAYDRIYAVIRDGDVAVAEERARLRQESQSRIQALVQSKREQAEEARLNKVFAARTEVEEKQILDRKRSELGHPSPRPQPPQPSGALWPRRASSPSGRMTDADGYILPPEPE